jgi:hypothetical protein
MAIIVEDGTGLADAETYISVADADTYHSQRANAAWALLDTPAKEAALRKATDYMMGCYGSRWLGERVSATQALDWPRFDVVARGFSIASDAIPAEVQRACAELALRASSADLAPDIGQRTLREKVDVIEVEYDRYSPQFTQFRAIDNLLAPFLDDRGGTIRRVVRA